MSDSNLIHLTPDQRATLLAMRELRGELQAMNADLCAIREQVRSMSLQIGQLLVKIPPVPDIPLAP